MTPLRKRMTEELQLRNLSPVTAAVYLNAVERFANHFHASPDRLGAEQVRQWLLYLINDRKVTASTLQVHRAALRFLYATTLKQSWFDDLIPWPKRIRPLPHVMAACDVAAILNATRNLKHWTIIATLYATGIRIGELIRLQLGDIDSKQMVIHIREGKGRIPRDVILSPALLERLRTYCRRYKPTSLLFPSDRRADGLLDPIAADPKRLGARVGFLAVLHTWDQKMLHHPHLHCLVPAGGLSLDRSRWVHCRKRYFLPSRVLGARFRNRFLKWFAQAYREKKIRLSGKLSELRRPAAFDRLYSTLKKKRWVVYAKRPFGGPEQVLKYLARYTHRIAISNGRLLRCEDGAVTFRWRDSRNGNAQKALTVDPVEFIRRFLLHVLPAGFVKIRYFGFLANGTRRTALALCRSLIGRESTDPHLLSAAQTRAVERKCPVCQTGTLLVVAYFKPDGREREPVSPSLDTS